MNIKSSNKPIYRNSEDLFNSPVGKWIQQFSNYKGYLREQPKDINLSRIFPLSYFIDMINYSTLTFVKPELWSDRLENHFLKQSIRENRWTGSNLYALCWTTKSKVKDLWKEYCDIEKETGIRVYTNMNKIHQHIIDINNTYRGKDYYTGLIQYHPKKDIEAFIESTFVNNSNRSSDTSYIRSYCLFIKDNEYKWESEFRIVFENQKGMINESKIYNVPIDLTSMIEKIELHPETTSKDKIIIAKILKRKKLNHLIYW